MPGGDRTGPMGFGPMTGRGMGWCARPAYADIADTEYGRGYASRRRPAYGYGPGRANMFGRGRGRGWRHRYYATGAPGWARYGWGGPSQYGGWAAPAENELDNLKEYAAGLEQELSDIKSRMTELEREKGASTAPEA